MTMLPTFLAGANWVMHSAGWLEGGLVAGYEKFVVDVEFLQMLQHEFTPLEIDEASMAYDAHVEVGHGAQPSLRVPALCTSRRWSSSRTDWRGRRRSAARPPVIGSLD